MAPCDGPAARERPAQRSYSTRVWSSTNLKFLFSSSAFESFAVLDRQKLSLALCYVHFVLLCFALLCFVILNGVSFCF